MRRGTNHAISQDGSPRLIDRNVCACICLCAAAFLGIGTMPTAEAQSLNEAVRQQLLDLRPDPMGFVSNNCPVLFAGGTPVLSNTLSTASPGAPGNVAVDDPILTFPPFLDFGISTTFVVQPSQLGTSLRFLCGDPDAMIGTVGAAAAGFSAAASQSTAASPVIKRRLRRLKDDEDDEKTKALQGASPDTVFELTDRLGAFVSVDYELLDRNVTSLEDGFNADGLSLTGGIDYQFRKNLLLGVAFNYKRLDGSFDGGGDFENTTYSGLIYANIIPAENFFVEAVVSAGVQDLDNNRPVSFIKEQTMSMTPIQSRIITGNASSDANGRQFEGRVQGGYDLNFGRYTVGPRLGMNVVRNEVQGFTEQGDSGIELAFDDQTRTSVQSTVGLFGSAAYSTRAGVIVPQILAEYVHEFDDDQRDIAVRFAEDFRPQPSVFTFQNNEPDRDFMHLNAGASMVLANNVTPFVNYRGLFFHNLFDEHSFSGGVRYTF